MNSGKYEGSGCGHDLELAVISQELHVFRVFASYKKWVQGLRIQGLLTLPKITRKMATDTIWNWQLSRTNCMFRMLGMFHILGEVDAELKVSTLYLTLPVYLTSPALHLV